MYLLPLFIFCVLVMMKRAERQRRTAALELSQLTFDALPEDAKERVRECRRERAKAIEARTAANQADLKQQTKLAIVLVATALIFTAVVAVFYH